MIDIIVPVLGRPQNAQPLVDSIQANTTGLHTITFICSPEDTAEIKACSDTDARVLVMSHAAGPGDAARKWNRGFLYGVAPFAFMAADDVEFTQGWDVAILEVAKKTGAGMVGSNDDANPLVKRGKHSTHSLFRRSYIDTVGGTFFDGPGVVYHEGYKHQWIDTEACRAAMDRGLWAFARRSVVRHHHPFYDKAVKLDETYRKALGDASHDSLLFKQRVQRWSRERRTR